MPQEKQNPRQPVLKPAADPARRWLTRPLEEEIDPMFYRGQGRKVEDLRWPSAADWQWLKRPKTASRGEDVNLPIERDAKGTAITRAAIIAELGKKK